MLNLRTSCAVALVTEWRELGDRQTGRRIDKKKDKHDMRRVRRRNVTVKYVGVQL